MKILAVGPTHPFRGGAAQYTTLLVRALRQRHEVFFASYSRQYISWMYPGKTDRDPTAEPIVERTDLLFDAVKPWNWRRLAELASEQRPDLIVLPWTVTYWAPFFYLFLKKLRARPGSPKVLFLCHNIVEHDASALKSSISRRVLGLADFFVTHSLEDAAHLRELLALPDDSRIRTSPHPEYRHLNTGEMNRREARRHLGITAERVLLFFGLVRKYKGLEHLVESLPLILAELPVHLLVVGEFWGGARWFEERVRALGIERHVTLVPRYVPDEEVSRYFSACDLVAVPYLSATQSGIVQVAYGFERPVVASRVGGLPEVVAEGKTGYLVPPGDPAAIAAAVVDFYRQGRGPAMAEAIRETSHVFSWDRMVEAIESFGAPAS